MLKSYWRTRDENDPRAPDRNAHMWLFHNACQRPRSACRRGVAEVGPGAADVAADIEAGPAERLRRCDILD